MTAEALIAAVCARGSDTDDLRDAAHEAHHALESGAKKWDRVSIDKALKRRFKRPAAYAASEMMARAVEQLVCAHFGVDCGGVEKWALVACMESIKFGDPHLPFKDAVKAIKNRMEWPECRAAADAVIALAVSK